MSLPRIQSSLDKIESEIAEAQAEVQRVEELLRGFRGETGSKFEALMEDINAKFVILRNELSGLRGDISGMRSASTAKMDALEKRIMNLEVVFKKLEESLRQA
jgi:chromosome segregation ATPase